jgi:hypothetical protein
MIRQSSHNTVPQTADIAPVFARHETFHPRFGWLKKGFDAVNQNPAIFLAEDAHIQLGVGKNMAKSIRYWCGAFKLIDDGRICAPSEFGNQLLDDHEGFDPFLEDPASLWLLHWNLLKNVPEHPCMATAWYFIFLLLRQAEFSQEDLANALQDYYDRSFDGSRIAESSLKKDATCILRMYVRQGAEVSLNEDNLDCPFAELGLIQRVGDSKHFTFRMGQKNTLSPEIIVAVCLDYANWVGHGQSTIAVRRLLYEIGSPGMAFKLSESALYNAIEQVSSWCTDISLDDTAGLSQLSYKKSPNLLMGLMLDRHYRQTNVL